MPDMATPQTRILSEYDKDWSNPAFRDVYVSLALGDDHAPDNKFLNWLNENGFANLTCCPHCHVDDFTHVEGCALAAVIEQHKIRRA